MSAEIREQYNAEELDFFRRYNTPPAIQDYIDSLEYNGNTDSKSPREVIRQKNAHCFEGALLAAACLEMAGYPPLVVDLKAENDDDHVIAVFRTGNHWGAIAKSNFTMLRYREPVYRSLRELSMSYFDFYFNVNGEKSLRAYSRTHDLRKFDHLQWRTTANDLEDIGYYLNDVFHYPLLTASQVKQLSAATPLLLKSGLLGSKPAGLYQPVKKKGEG